MQSDEAHEEGLCVVPSIAECLVPISLGEQGMRIVGCAAAACCCYCCLLFSRFRSCVFLVVSRGCCGGICAIVEIMLWD